jgi:hypothetical protein
MHRDGACHGMIGSVALAVVLGLQLIVEPGKAGGRPFPVFPTGESFLPNL